MKTKYFIAGLIIILYFLPCFIQFDFADSYHIIGLGIDWPMIQSGDVPHYFVVESSLIQDLDFNIQNNYIQALEGGFDAGKKFKGRLLIPQSRYLDRIKNKMYIGRHFFQEPYKTLLKDVDRTNLKEYSVHPPALSILMSLFLWPMADSHFVEVLTIFFAVAFALIGLFYLYKTLFYYSKNEKAALLITFIFAFATPWWHYANTFTEVPFIGALFIAGYYFFVIKEQNFLPGLLLGLAVSIKYPFGAILLLFGFRRLIEKKIKQTLVFFFPAIILGFFVAYYNLTIFGNFDIAQRYYFTEWGNPLSGLFGISFSLRQGIFFFCPFIIFSLLGFKILKRDHKKDAFFVITLLISYYLVWGLKGINWTGGLYSNRYLVPILPILAIPLLFWYLENQMKPFWKTCFWIFVFISLLISFQAALFPALVLEKPPWELVNLLLTKSTKILSLIGVS